MKRLFVLALACCVATDARAEESAPPPPVRITPSFDGHIGAWLLYGPYASALSGFKPAPGVTPPDALATEPAGVTESALTPSTASGWIIASTNAGAIDVKTAFKASPLAQKTELIAYAAGTLHLARAAKLYMLLGSDDGIRVSVDGQIVLTRDEARPQRDDDDMVPLDLAAGDHPILMKLHQRDGAWSFRVRIVDAHLAPPGGAYLVLPGTTPDNATQLAERMARGYVELGMRADAYVPHLHARYTEGAPLGVPLRVKATLETGGVTLFDVDAGDALTTTTDVDVQLPALPELATVEDKVLTVHASIGGRAISHTFFPRKSIREAVKRADEVLGRFAQATHPAWLREDTLESVQYARNRLAGAQNRGDMDAEALTQETRDLSSAIDALAHDKDPYATRTGAMRMAYRSPIDNGLDEYGLYVPAGWSLGARHKFPLIVALHGLNGKPMAMMRWLFGGDDPKKEQDWEERHVDPLPPLDAFVITPSAHGNTMYRDLGEEDPLRVLDRIMARFPIDPDRVTITGPSMGGIGAALIPLRHPDRFAAAEPLCGYHSYFVRRDIFGRPIRPWERAVAEDRSNAEWALNGFGLPLFIVHGTKDLPVENSGVLIDAYEKLHYSVEHEHPELGHNVWQTTYENLRGAKWLLDKRRDPHPRRVRFRTMSLRDGRSYWVSVNELVSPAAWGQVDARVTGRSAISVVTSGVSELALDRDAVLVDPKATLTVTLDNQPLTFAPDVTVVMHRAGSTWTAGPAGHATTWKRGEITGPIRDAFHAPLLFVWGASDPDQARANEEVARAWAAIRGGVSVRYPIISDTDFVAQGQSLGNERALFLVGNAKSNQVVRLLEPELPVRIDGDAVVIGDKRITGEQSGAAFIRPNPRRPDRYVVVVEGTSALGTWRSLSLPDLLPDFVVWDVGVAPARGQILLSAGSLRAAGFFKNDWSLPELLDDPLAATHRPGAKNEYDATPYLP